MVPDRVSRDKLLNFIIKVPLKAAESLLCSMLIYNAHGYCIHGKLSDHWGIL